MATVKTFFILRLLLQGSLFSYVNSSHGEGKPTMDTTQVFCTAFTPPQYKCTQDSMCKTHEVCVSALCQDTCQVKPCGVNTRCTSSNHDRNCSCEDPWKGDPYKGCRSQDLQWIQTRAVPNHAICSKTQLAVCKATGPDSGWHSGFVKDEQCIYEYNGGSHRASNYEVLVDPCEGRGWKWMEGYQSNMVSYDKSVRFPGVEYYVCSVKSDGVVGKLFNTRNGFLCHVAKDNTRDGNFYALVSQPCI